MQATESSCGGPSSATSSPLPKSSHLFRVTSSAAVSPPAGWGETEGQIVISVKKEKRGDKNTGGAGDVARSLAGPKP